MLQTVLKKTVLLQLLQHIFIKYIPDETYMKFWYFSKNMSPPLECWKSNANV